MELLAETLAVPFRMSVDEAVDALVNEHDSLAAGILNGVPDGNFECVVGWLREVQRRAGELGALLMSDPKAMHAVLSHLSTGLIANNSIVQVRNCKCLSAIGQALSGTRLASSASKWFLGAGGPLAALLSILQQDSGQEAASAVAAAGGDNALYLSAMEKVLNGVAEHRRGREAFILQAVPEALLDAALATEAKHAASNADVHRVALTFITSLWLHFPDQVEAEAEKCKAALDALKRELRTGSRDQQLFAVACLFRLLEGFTLTGNAFAPILYKTIIFALVEHSGEPTLRNAFLGQMRDVLAANPSLPVGVLLDPLLRQVIPNILEESGGATSPRGSEGAAPAIQLLVQATQHPKLESRHALALLPPLAQVALAGPRDFGGEDRLPALAALAKRMVQEVEAPLVHNALLHLAKETLEAFTPGAEEGMTEDELQAWRDRAATLLFSMGALRLEAVCKAMHGEVQSAAQAWRERSGRDHPLLRRAERSLARALPDTPAEDEAEADEDVAAEGEAEAVPAEKALFRRTATELPGGEEAEEGDLVQATEVLDDAAEPEEDERARQDPADIPLGRIVADKPSAPSESGLPAAASVVGEEENEEALRRQKKAAEAKARRRKREAEIERTRAKRLAAEEAQKAVVAKEKEDKERVKRALQRKRQALLGGKERSLVVVKSLGDPAPEVLVPEDPQKSSSAPASPKKPAKRRRSRLVHKPAAPEAAAGDLQHPAGGGPSLAAAQSLDPTLPEDIEELILEALNQRLAVDPNIVLPVGFERVPAMRAVAERSPGAAEEELREGRQRLESAEMMNSQEVPRPFVWVPVPQGVPPTDDLEEVEADVILEEVLLEVTHPHSDEREALRQPVAADAGEHILLVDRLAHLQLEEEAQALHTAALSADPICTLPSGWSRRQEPRRANLLPQQQYMAVRQSVGQMRPRSEAGSTRSDSRRILPSLTQIERQRAPMRFINQYLDKVLTDIAGQVVDEAHRAADRKPRREAAQRKVADNREEGSEAEEHLSTAPAGGAPEAGGASPAPPRSVRGGRSIRGGRSDGGGYSSLSEGELSGNAAPVARRLAERKKKQEEDAKRELKERRRAAKDLEKKKEKIQKRLVRLAEAKAAEEQQKEEEARAKKEAEGLEVKRRREKERKRRDEEKRKLDAHKKNKAQEQIELSHQQQEKERQAAAQRKKRIDSYIRKKKAAYRAEKQSEDEMMMMEQSRGLTTSKDTHFSSENWELDAIPEEDETSNTLGGASTLSKKTRSTKSSRDLTGSSPSDLEESMNLPDTMTSLPPDGLEQEPDPSNVVTVNDEVDEEADPEANAEVVVGADAEPNTEVDGKAGAEIDVELDGEMNAQVEEVLNELLADIEDE
eukprot:gene3024-3844_t